MFLIFIPGIFYKVHLPGKKKKEKKSIKSHCITHFYKVKSFLLHAVHLFISSLYSERKGVNLGTGSFWSAGRC